MRIIFVGLHNKPEMKPLDILTKTGKLVNRIIKELPAGLDILKTNLFDVEVMPHQSKLPELANDWYWTHLPVDDDIIIVMGNMAHEYFNFQGLNVIKVAHPASKRSHAEMNDYVEKTANKIKAKL